MQGFLKLTGFKIALVVVLVIAALGAIRPEFMEFVDQMELKAYDLRVKWRGSRPVGDEIVIVAIDDKSLDELGRFPWPRARFAEFLDQMARLNAAVVGFDVIFSEVDDSSGLSTLTRLRESFGEKSVRLQEVSTFLEEAILEADNDAKMAQALVGFDRAILGYFFHFNLEDVRHIAPEKLTDFYDSIVPSEYEQVYMGPGMVVPVKALAVEANIKRLAKASKGFGYFNVFPDPDGVVRQIPLMIQYQDVNTPFPPLSLEMVKEYMEHVTGSQVQLVAVVQPEETLVSLDLDGEQHIVPTDRFGQMLVNYYGPRGSFPCVSFTDVIHDRVDPAIFDGRIVLVGATATGVYDVRTTPFGPVFPGVEVHATVLDNILHGDYLQKMEHNKLLNVLLIIGLGLVLGWIKERVGAALGFLVTFAFAISYLSFNFYLFSGKGLWLNVVYPIMTMGFVYLGVTVFRYMTEEREKRFIKGAFSQYLSPVVIEALIEDPNRLRLGGEKRVLTAFFSDIQGFSTISEQLTPEELVSMLNEYLTDMSNVIMAHQGTVDKYEGDAIMAFWGAPIETEDHAIKCCLACIEMQRRVEELRNKWASENKPQIHVRMGVNSGAMVVGNMGSMNKMDYTIMGDAVNLASRLEGTNKEYRTRIMFGEDTLVLLNNEFVIRELDRIRVVGKVQPVTVYELVGKAGEVSDHWERLISTYSVGLRAYRSRQWQEAIRHFERCLEISPGDGPSSIFVARCKEYEESPPPEGWDTVYVRTTK